MPISYVLIYKCLVTDVKIGTTETQRAVSYYEIPSRAEDPGYLDKMGDVIPAGRPISLMVTALFS